MNFFKKIFICFITFAEIQAGTCFSRSYNEEEAMESLSKLRRERNEKEEKERWEKIKKEILEQIADGKHPDTIKVKQFCWSKTKTSALLACVDKDDKELTRLLLEKGADANQIVDYDVPILAQAKTVPMAQLLLEFGAQETLNKSKVHILPSIIRDGEDALLPFYFDKGLDHTGSCPMQVLLALFPSPSKARFLIKEGLSIQAVIQHRGHNFHGHTLPQCIKHSWSGRTNFNKKKEEMRIAIIDEQKKRKEYCKQLPSHIAAAGTPLLPELAALTAEFTFDISLANETDYEKLENEPLPKQACE